MTDNFFRHFWQKIFPAKSTDPQAIAKRMFLNKTKVHNEQLAISNAIQAALQHNPTYTPNASYESKIALRAKWAQLLRNIARQYNSPVDDGVHVQNIRNISDVLSNEFAPILQGRRLRIGTSQKSLNLYLNFFGVRDGCLAENHHFRTLSYEPTRFWLPFCQLIRPIAGFCASSLPVSTWYFRGMVIAEVAFAVSHALCNYKIIDFALF